MSYHANLNRLQGYRRDLEIKQQLSGRLRFTRFKVSSYACCWCLHLTDRLYGNVIACCAEHARLALAEGLRRSK